MAIAVTSARLEVRSLRSQVIRLFKLHTQDAHVKVERIARNDDFIRSRIFTMRGVQVMQDSALARIYQVETRVFNQSVKRNESRFPSNFRFPVLPLWSCPCRVWT